MSEPEPDDDMRDQAASGQPKQRRARRETHRPIISLEQLPLFADERSLSEAVLGHGQYTHWRAVVTLLEGRGFPKIDGLMGGRYTHAVRAFFDREYRIHGETQISKPHQPANLGASWKKR